MLKNPLRAKSVVMTLFGDSITPHGGEIWLGSLIELLASFGISDRLVRTSVFRLVEEGWLNASRVGRRSLYTLNTSATSRLERAYRRVYTPSRVAWNAQWTVLFVNDSTITPNQRTALKKELLWEGYASLAANVFIHPSAELEVLNEIIARLDLANVVFVCLASNADQVCGQPMSNMVAQYWQLEKIIAEYDYFIECFKPLCELLKSNGVLNAEEAFVIRTIAIHEFRRVQLHDPQLPSELLPENWPGKIAYALCHDIYQLSYQNAQDYVLNSIRKENPEATEAAPHFYQRFNGLIPSL